MSAASVTIISFKRNYNLRILLRGTLKCTSRTTCKRIMVFQTSYMNLSAAVTFIIWHGIYDLDKVWKGFYSMSGEHSPWNNRHLKRWCNTWINSRLFIWCSRETMYLKKTANLLKDHSIWPMRVILRNHITSLLRSRKYSHDAKAIDKQRNNPWKRWKIINIFMSSEVTWRLSEISPSELISVTCITQWEMQQLCISNCIPPLKPQM